jgi:ribosomal protein S12 methylthiotransferase accessory factor
VVSSVGKFFSNKPDFEFVAWNFEGTTEEEYSYLMGILKKMEKEVYIADYMELGAHSCRILVPDYSEVYEVDDLIWDNHNIALEFREDILNLHKLSDEELLDLVERLEESERDDYSYIKELIGVAFEEASVWGQLTIAELKCLIHLALKRYDDAKGLAQMLTTYNDNTPARRKFLQVLNILLDIQVDDELDLENYYPSLERMYGKALLDEVIACVKGDIRFHGLTSSCTNLSGLDKHQRLIESYQKLQSFRADAQILVSTIL